MSAHPVVVVVGVAGGCGASTLACGLALALTRSGRPACLLELDLERGDAAGEFGIAPGRGLAELVAVAGELTAEHVRQVAFPHSSGMTVLVAPGRPGAGADWDGPALARLVNAAADERVCVVDAGPAVSPSVLAAATSVLAVAPRTVAGARRARRLGEVLTGAPARLVAAPARGVPERELSTRALSLAAGLAVCGSLPHVERDAADLAGGRWPRRRRAPLGDAVSALGELVA